MNFLPGCFPAGGARGLEKDLRFLSFSREDSPGFGVSFPGVDVGDPDGTRRLLALVTLRSATTTAFVSDVTIGGVAATEILQYANSGNSRNGTVGVYIAHVPAGTTADVAVEFTNFVGSAVVGLFRMINMNSYSVFDFAPDSDGDNNAEMSIDVPAGGYVIGVAAIIASSECDWVGLTELYDEQEGSDTHSAAMIGPLSAQSGYELSATQASTASRHASVSFG